MSKKLVLISRPPQTPEGLKSLYDYFKVKINEGLPFNKNQLKEAIKQVDGLFCDDDKIDAELLEGVNKLRIITNYGVGYDNIDVEAARKKGIAVTNTPEVLTDTVADFTIVLMLSVSRRIAEANGILKCRKTLKWERFYLPTYDFYNKTLGIIGFGRIGQAIAKRALGFNMKIIYNDIQPLKANEENKLQVRYKKMDELLKESDFISLNCNLNEHTYHLIGEKQLNLIKSTAFIINTSRGAVIDEKALINVLQQKKIAGAALDVFENEPNVPNELLDLDNVVATPHMASGTYETRLAMTEKCCKNLIMALNGKTPQDLVNPPWKIS